MSVISRLQKTTDVIREYTSLQPTVGVVLGSGLGNFKMNMEIDCEIPYEDIPNFPISTVEGHRGTLIFGSMAGKPLVCMAGRFHFYEGYSPADIAFPIRVLKWLGMQTLLISNAAGGMHPDFEVGDLMMIRDHISLFAHNPLIGPNEPELGPRFPDMSEPYSLPLLEKAKALAGQLNIRLHEGVYAGVTGPTFETRAEYKMLHLLGADAVGMSTVQEVIVARHMGIPVFGVSVITDLGISQQVQVITHEEVLEAAAAAEPRLTALFKALISEL
jgi:purine-nucleoside phosphorylase